MVYQAAIVLSAMVALCFASERTGAGWAQLSSYAPDLPGPPEQCSTLGANGVIARVVNNLGTVVVAVGEIVVFNCQAEASRCNTSEKQFTIQGRAIGEGVTTVDSETTVLHMCVSAETNGTYVRCECRQENVTSPLDMIYVISARRPAAETTNITCWAESDENITCYWNPAYRGFPPELEMKWTASYVVIGAEDEISGSCQLHPDRTMCTIPVVHMSQVYLINVTGTCVLGRIHLHTQVEVTSDIVKPPPVKVNRVSTTATSIELELLPPVGPPGSYMSYLYYRKGLACEAMVYDDLSGTVIKVDKFLMKGQIDVIDVMASGTPVTFTLNVTGLLPFQLHRIRIRCKVNDGGQFWSDSVYESASTREAAPSVGPTVFYTSGFTPSKRQCMNGWYGYNIYWQGIPQASRVSNGLIAYYTVQLIPRSRDRNKRWSPRSTSLARVGPDERQAWICLPGESEHVITVHAATGAGVGPAAGALVIPPRDKVEALTVKPCHIFVRRSNSSDVLVSYKASGKTGSGAAIEKEHPVAAAEFEAQEFEGSEKSSFWTVAWCLQADGNCKGDIHQIRANPGSRTLMVTVNGSVLEYGFGISRTVDGVSGGITWADCSHDTLAGPSLADEPTVMVDKEGVHVQIMREYCSAAITPEETQMLHYCPALAQPTEKCATSAAAALLTKGVAVKINASSCCQGDMISRELDSCDEFLLLPLIGDASDYIVWLSYSSPLWDHLSSAAVFVSLSQGGNRHGWTIEIICIVVGCAAVVGGILVVFAYRKLKPNMKLGRIYKVPALREMPNTSTTLFDEGTEKHKEYLPMMQWQAHVNLSLAETDVNERRRSPAPSVASGDSGLSSFRSRGVSRTGAEKDFAECSFQASDYSPRSSTFFPDEAEKENAPSATEAERCGAKPSFSNAGYQHDSLVGDYFRPLALPLHGGIEAAHNAEFEYGVKLDAANTTNEREAGKLAMAAAAAGETAAFHDSVNRSRSQVVAATEQPDRRRENNQTADQATPPTDPSALCSMCNRNKQWSLDGNSALLQCRCFESGRLPDDDYCYAGNKRTSADGDDVNGSACSSSEYVQCAQDGYDEDDAGDEPVEVDISQFF